MNIYVHVHLESCTCSHTRAVHTCTGTCTDTCTCTYAGFTAEPPPLPLRQDIYRRLKPVVVNDGVEPVRDGDDGTVLELCPDGLLDEVVGVHVDRRRRLVEHEHLGVLNEGTCQAHQLLLTGAVDRFTS